MVVHQPAARTRRAAFPAAPSPAPQTARHPAAGHDGQSGHSRRTALLGRPALAELQRSAGNRATTRLIQRVPTPPSPPTPDPATALAEATERAREAVRAAAAPLVGTADAAKIPDLLSRKIVNGKGDPRGKRAKPGALTPLMDVLWGASLQADLDVIDRKGVAGTKRVKKRADARRALFQQILGGLVTSTTSTSAPGTPLSATQLADERKLVASELVGLTSNNRWEDVRVAVIVRFGGLEDGTQKAIERANAYYRSLVPLAFLTAPTSTRVHPDLQAALSRAEAYLAPRMTKLTAPEQAEVRRVISKAWSTVIRPNQNARHRLSEHSFGFAVDFDAALSPNVGSGNALAPVAAVTGRDPKAITTAGKAAAGVQSAAADLQAISQAYVAAMTDEASLAPVLLRLANEARAKEKATPLAAGVGPDLVTAILAKKSARKKAVLDALWPEAGKPPAAVSAAVDTVMLVGDAFRASFTDAKRTKKVKATTEGTLGSVAAHGFTSIPPVLAAALAGSDAGNLTWLGTASVHDYMHFELPTRPALY